MASKFADAISVRFLGKGKGKSSSPAPDPDEDVPPDADYTPKTPKGDDDGDKPGAKGKLLAAAIRKGNGEAIEECIRSICG